MKLSLLFLASWLVATSFAKADESHQEFRIIGVFDEEQVAEFKQGISDLHDAELVSFDYETGKAVVQLGPPWLKQRDKNREEFVTRFGHDLRLVTQGVFDARASSGFPREKWSVEKIPVFGLDCRGCSYGAYLAVCDLQGVEQVLSSLHDGIVTVWFNPEKIDLAAMKKALLDAKVALKPIESMSEKK